MKKMTSFLSMASAIVLASLTPLISQADCGSNCNEQLIFERAQAAYEAGVRPSAQQLIGEWRQTGEVVKRRDAIRLYMAESFPESSAPRASIRKVSESSFLSDEAQLLISGTGFDDSDVGDEPMIFDGNSVCVSSRYIWGGALTSCRATLSGKLICKSEVKMNKATISGYIYFFEMMKVK